MKLEKLVNEVLDYGYIHFSDEENSFDEIYKDASYGLRVVATLPLTILGKVYDEDNWLGDRFMSSSKIVFGLDRKGQYVAKDKPLIFVAHSHKPIVQEHDTEDKGVNISQEEFDRLITGNLPNNKKIKVYSVEDVIKGKVRQPFTSQYGIWVDGEEAEILAQDGFYGKKAFFENPLVLALGVDIIYLNYFFEIFQDGYGQVKVELMPKTDLDEPTVYLTGIDLSNGEDTPKLYIPKPSEPPRMLSVIDYSKMVNVIKLNSPLPEFPGLGVPFRNL